LLFPVVGSLVEDRLVVEGKAYSLPRHGFARRSLFTCVEQGADHVRFTLPTVMRPARSILSRSRST
jgi:galactose mutarotase-like enzyme